MVARMLGAAARHEVEHSIERQRAAKRQAGIDGKFRGARRPFGYERNGITAHPEEAAAIREGAKAVLSGVSLRQISRDWNAQGLRTSFGANEFNSREVRKILLRPRNAGISLLDDGKDDKGVKRVKRVPNGQWERSWTPTPSPPVEALLRDPSRGATSAPNASTRDLASTCAASAGPG